MVWGTIECSNVHVIGVHPLKGGQEWQKRLIILYPAKISFKRKDENKSLFHTIEAERIGDNPLKEMINFSTGKKMTPYLKPTTKQ